MSVAICMAVAAAEDGSAADLALPLVCAEPIRRWARIPSPEIDGFDARTKGIVQGFWQRRDVSVNDDAGLLRQLGLRGTFEFSTFQSLLDRRPVLANISGEFYLVNSSLTPIPAPLILDASGILHPPSGELCLACCPRNASSRAQPSDCRIRATIRIHYPVIRALDASITGTIESLTESGYSLLPTIDLLGSIQNIKDEQVVRAALQSTEVVLVLVELASVATQIHYSLGNPAAASRVSMLGLAVQAGAIGWRWAKPNWKAMIYPRRHAYRPLWRSKLWVASMASNAAVVVAYCALTMAVLRGRVVARSAAPPIWAAIWVALPYLAIWRLAASSESALELLLVLWLLPQVMVNAAADLRPSHPLTMPFLLGVSACRFLALAHTHFRPRLPVYTDIFRQLPRHFFWPLALLLHALLILAFFQQTHGGRCFLPSCFRRHHPEYASTPSSDDIDEKVATFEL